MAIWVRAPQSLGFWHPVSLISTWFGTGLLRPAAGTWGSLASLPFAWFFLNLGGKPLLLVAVVLVFALGTWAAHQFEKASHNKDPSSVVVDEVAGQWLALLFVPQDFLGFAIGFALFRIFDVSKIWPINIADRDIGGGFGIMADDILAGLFAGLVALVTFQFV
jgi:phosphatidylglycerophosphatase A